MYCVYCGANLGPADLYCTRCGKPKVEAPPAQFSTSAPAPAPSPPEVALPPNLHWGVVFLLQFLTCGIFGIIWGFVLAFWAKKLAPESKAVFLIFAYAGCIVLAIVLSADEFTGKFGALVNLTGIACYIMALFQIKGSMEDYYTWTEKMGLYLSGVMTFFFGVIYLQYHVNRISRWKETGAL